MTSVIETHTKTPRAELLAALRARDGNRCRYPGCNETLDFSIDYASLEPDDPRRKLEPTIDHWIPQHYGRVEGWTYDEIWDLSNLRLMTKRCNAKKGDRLPNEDGTLPERITRKFRYRRQKRAGRPDLCVSCDNGHGLGVDEVCADCGCNAKRFPRWAQVSFPECDHELFWCWVCSITPDMRPASIGTAMRQSDSDELGEWNTD